MHDETWAGLWKKKGSEDFPGGGNHSGVCCDSWLVPHVRIILLSHLGQAELFGTCWAGHSWRKQFGPGYGCSVVPSKGRIFLLPLTQQETGKRRGRTTQRGRYLVVPRAHVRMRTGKASLSGHTLEGGAGHCLPDVWSAIAPLMKPWCAEGEVPTAANLNLYRGWRSCVGWHCDDEPLFGECGDAKLIVSVSFGSSAVFKWRRQSCPDDEGHLCCLGHGDILVMDDQCPGQVPSSYGSLSGTGTDKRHVPLDQTTCFLLSFA